MGYFNLSGEYTFCLYALPRKHARNWGSSPLSVSKRIILPSLM